MTEIPELRFRHVNGELHDRGKPTGVIGHDFRPMAAGRLRRMDPDLAFQPLAGPIVMHLLWRPAAGSRGDGPPVGEAPLEEVVDELVGVWLRAMATDQQAAPEVAAPTPPWPRRKRVGRPAADEPPRGRP